MLGISLEETRVGQEMKAEGRLEVKLEMIPKLVSKGISLKEVADFLGLPVKDVQKVLQDQKRALCSVVSI